MGCAAMTIVLVGILTLKFTIANRAARAGKKEIEGSKVRREAFVT